MTVKSDFEQALEALKAGKPLTGQVIIPRCLEANHINLVRFVLSSKHFREHLKIRSE